MPTMFESTFKNFQINFNSVNPRNTFSCGDIITGTISFDLTKQTKITSISMGMSGKVHVHWSRGGGGRKGHRRHYSAKINFFNLKSVILQEDNAVGGTSKLPPGTHVYPFNCQIPQGDFPTTFHGGHGKIQYLLTVSIDRPWHFAKNFETEIQFVQRINNQPELWAPLSGFNTMTVCCLCWASGPVELRATLEKKAFMPGETAKVIFEISNASSRTVTPKARLQQRQTYYTHGRKNRLTGAKYLVTQTGELINPNTLDVHKELMLTIPPTANLTISNCSILEVEYLIEVLLGVRGSAEVIVRCPIIIYDNNIYNYLSL